MSPDRVLLEKCSPCNQGRASLQPPVTTWPPSPKLKNRFSDVSVRACASVSPMCVAEKTHPTYLHMENTHTGNTSSYIQYEHIHSLVYDRGGRTPP